MSNKRELIDTGTDKRYVRRDEKGGSRNRTMSGAHSPRTGVSAPRRYRSLVKETAAATPQRLREATTSPPLAAARC